MGNRTPPEIEELSLRTPRPVVIYLRESEAAAANVFSARKRSGSGKCFLRESEAAAAISPRRNLIGGSLAWKKQLYGTR